MFRTLFNKLYFDFTRKVDLLKLQEQVYRQLASFIQIQRFLGEELILKPMRGWALSPDAIIHVLFELQKNPHPLIYEFGSGQSTIVFASYLKKKGAGRIISIEHDANYADKLQKQIQHSGLEKFVELKVVPLKPQNLDEGSHGCMSYDLSESSKEKNIDVVLVDGPPEKNGALTRYFPLRWALDRLSLGGVAFLDDARRTNELLVIREITRTHPELHQEEFETEKGLHAFRRTI